MKYGNARDILPDELLELVRKYYQGGYLYIPKGSDPGAGRKTEYKTELEKRDRQIYLKRLEGRTNRQLGMMYHLSEPSIRRILAKERIRYQEMEEIIKEILPLWGMDSVSFSQIYPSAWKIKESHVLKVYSNQKQLERNIKISSVLLDCDIPVAETVCTKAGEPYVECRNHYFVMTKKLEGSNLTDIKDKKLAWEIGGAMARLHEAFRKCEKKIPFWDNSLLKEMKGWVRENLMENGWQPVREAEYLKAVGQLESVYDSLPKQLIHRDVHFGNFLFQEGSFSGYIDFDLSQKNIRIFDLCYFLAGLLAEEPPEAFTREEWLEIVKTVIAGYESVTKLSRQEKAAACCVMECIEILFVAYFIGEQDIKLASDAYRIFTFIQSSGEDLKRCLGVR